MARAIKFRAWNKNTQKMVDLKAITPFALDAGLNQDGLFIPFDENFELQQFTNLKDKDGCEIWEGDIVEGSWTNSEYKHNPNGSIICDDQGRPKEFYTERKEIGRIEWGHAGWKIFYPNWLSEEWQADGTKRPNETSLVWFGTWPSTLGVKVIGNIYENPDLLKK